MRWDELTGDLFLEAVQQTEAYAFYPYPASSGMGITCRLPRICSSAAKYVTVQRH